MKNAALARTAASEGMVLLENRDNTLPLQQSVTKVALFGGGAVRTVRGGTGSGDPFNGGLSGGGICDVNQSPRYHVNMMDSFLQAGYEVVTKGRLLEYADGYDKELERTAVSPMATFAYPEDALDADSVKGFSKLADTAIYVLARNSGEGIDRGMTKKIKLGDRECEVGDYLLSPTERNNLKYITSSFKNTILVLNIGGVIDMSFLSELDRLGAVLLMGQAGQEGGSAVLDVLTGKITPSGKLSDTWAADYSDYPASATFAHNDGNVDVEKYTEGIYVGYRWFDSFSKKPHYPFGYGLSYASFEWMLNSLAVEGENISVCVEVKNTSERFAGKEVIQVYGSAPEVNLEKPYQELAAYAKTGLLRPGESEALHIRFKIGNLASFDESKSCFLLERGDYRFRIGTSSRNTKPSFILHLDKDITTKLVYHELPLIQPLEEISRFGKPYGMDDGNWEPIQVFDVDASAIRCEDCRSKYQDGIVTTYTTDKGYTALLPYERVEYKDERAITLLDVINGVATMEDLVAQISTDDLAALNCGTGWGVVGESAPVVGENSSTVCGAAGETTPSFRETYAIPSIVMADGPAGVRVSQRFEAIHAATNEKVMRYQYCTAWPVGTLLAQTFDPQLIEQVGQGISEELEEFQIAILLGPGVNIHRDPLCGRNFEYYSEDPLLSGLTAAALVRGVQSKPGRAACLKHYAANNQESNRNKVDTIVGERALREIYLRSFELAVRESNPITMMTSYNLINGVPTADSFDLCTNIARGEWGFDGLIMTDWNGGSSTPSVSMHAGNALIMPGGPGRIRNIRLAAVALPPFFDQRGQIRFFEEKRFFVTREPEWNAFVPSPDGKEIAQAFLGEGFTAEVRDGMILVNGEPLFTEFVPDLPPQFIKPGMKTGYAHPVTAEDASVSADGKSVLYKGTMATVPAICRGDIQRCAIHNLNVIMRSITRNGTV